VTIGQGIDQDTHEGEHVVQTRLLGIRERRESLIDNLKRSRTRVNRMLIPHFCSTTNWKIEFRPGYVLFRGSNPSETSVARGEETGVEEGEGALGATQRTKPTNLAGAGCEEALDGELERALELVDPPRRRGIHRWRNPAKVGTPPPFEFEERRNG